MVRAEPGAADVTSTRQVWLLLSSGSAELPAAGSEESCPWCGSCWETLGQQERPRRIEAEESSDQEDDSS